MGLGRRQPLGELFDGLVRKVVEGLREIGADSHIEESFRVSDDQAVVMLSRASFHAEHLPLEDFLALLLQFEGGQIPQRLRDKPVVRESGSKVDPYLQASSHTALGTVRAISSTRAVDKIGRCPKSTMRGTVEFDRIAPIFDETRRPPSSDEIRVLAEVLSGSRSVLDAGVGTGRFAVPLAANHFEVVGVDLSLGMMQRARAKGIATLVRADIRRLPLREQAVDAAFMAHVLQLLPDPRAVLVELGRVARRVVVVLLPDWSERQPAGGWHGMRERYRELAAELGYPLPPRGQRYRHTLEDLRAIAPPLLVRPAEGATFTSASVTDLRARWEARAESEFQIPPAVHAEIVRRLEAEHPTDPSRWRRPRTERFVAWEPAELRKAGRDENSARSS